MKTGEENDTKVEFPSKHSINFIQIMRDSAEEVWLKTHFLLILLFDHPENILKVFLQYFSDYFKAYLVLTLLGQ